MLMVNSLRSSGIIENVVSGGLQILGAVPTALMQAVAPESIQQKIESNISSVRKWTGAGIAAAVGISIL